MRDAVLREILISLNFHGAVAHSQNRTFPNRFCHIVLMMEGRNRLQQTRLLALAKFWGDGYRPAAFPKTVLSVLAPGDTAAIVLSEGVRTRARSVPIRAIRAAIVQACVNRVLNAQVVTVRAHAFDDARPDGPRFFR